MKPEDPVTYELLLDAAIGRLDPDAHRELERRLAADPAVAERYERVRRTLEPLDAWVSPPPPTRLVDSVMDRIEAERFPRLAGSTLPPAERRASGRRPIVSLPELVALAACLTIFIGVFVPSLSKSRFLAQRAQCGANLASVFSGLRQYADMNGGCLPNVGLQAGDNWLTQRPNRRNLHVLARLHLVKPEDLICPSRSDLEPMPSQQVLVRVAVPDRKYIGYDLHNVAGPQCKLRQAAIIAIGSDANPLFEDGKFHPNLDPRETNTRGHHRLGQNVLYGDGRVIWTASPIMENGDNIWTAQDHDEYDGDEVPASATDAFLVP